MSDERLTYTIPEVAGLLGIGRNLAYELAARDELGVPVLHLGRRLLVPKAPLLALLGQDDDAANGDGWQKREGASETEAPGPT
ncbi:MAG: helix-turn-helix domain-containing protein [Acidimicrobiia bacterium]